MPTLWLLLPDSVTKVNWLHAARPAVGRFAYRLTEGDEVEEVKATELRPGEFGVTGTQTLQQTWLHDAFADMPNYPLLRSVAYFEAKDTPGAGGSTYANPDWRVSRLLKLAPPSKHHRSIPNYAARLLCLVEKTSLVDSDRLTITVKCPFS